MEEESEAESPQSSLPTSPSMEVVWNHREQLAFSDRKSHQSHSSLPGSQSTRLDSFASIHCGFSGKMLAWVHHPKHFTTTMSPSIPYSRNVLITRNSSGGCSTRNEE